MKPKLDEILEIVDVCEHEMLNLSDENELEPEPSTLSKNTMEAKARKKQTFWRKKFNELNKVFKNNKENLLQTVLWHLDFTRSYQDILQPLTPLLDFQLCLKLETGLGEQRFRTNGELHGSVQNNLNTVAATFFEEGI
ncbi:hypothetical protein AVEN_48469-1 [Araneus ventricosus]|uniref:Uncharacterized protein n=1 Tax=Araneus ventricosus TaxID=182803 RepID=A0A4Y2KY63_ARAVE|nr:hypothetical protein AVEN_48469-1 [Araneus ventricosus]